MDEARAFSLSVWQSVPPLQADVVVAAVWREQERRVYGLRWRAVARFFIRTVCKYNTGKISLAEEHHTTYFISFLATMIHYH